jgi:hypothetical protein
MLFSSSRIDRANLQILCSRSRCQGPAVSYIYIYSVAILHACFVTIASNRYRTRLICTTLLIHAYICMYIARLYGIHIAMSNINMDITFLIMIMIDPFRIPKPDPNIRTYTCMYTCTYAPGVLELQLIDSNSLHLVMHTCIFFQMYK